MGAMLSDGFPTYCKKIPTQAMPVFLVRLLAKFSPTMKTVISDIELLAFADCGYVTEMTCVTFRPSEETIRVVGQSLIDHGVV